MINPHASLKFQTSFAMGKMLLNMLHSVTAMVITVFETTGCVHWTADK